MPSEVAVKEPEAVEVEVEGAEEIKDPGQAEGTKKNPKTQQDNITPDSPRFKEVYGKMKGFERELKELKEQGADTSTIDEMRKHNQDLMEVIKSRDTSSGDNEVEKMEKDLQDLRADKKAARDQADFDLETDIDDKMADLRIDIRDAKKASKALAEDDIYTKWANETAWFKNNKKKREAAIQFEKDIINEDDFADATDQQVLKEVEKRVENKFKPVKGKTPVEGSDTHGTGYIPSSVKISKTESEIADGFGISVQDFAKQKAAIGRK